MNKNNFQNLLITALGLVCFGGSSSILYTKLYPEALEPRGVVDVHICTTEVISMSLSSIFEEESIIIAESLHAQDQLSQIIQFLHSATEVELLFAIDNLENESLDLTFARLITLGQLIKISYPKTKCKISAEIIEGAINSQDLFSIICKA